MELSLHSHTFYCTVCGCECFCAIKFMIRSTILKSDARLLEFRGCSRRAVVAPAPQKLKYPPQVGAETRKGW